MFEQGASISATQINALKTRVNAEMKRRKYTGSVTSYADSTWAYTTTPAVGGAVLIEHANKIITPLNAINSTGYKTVAKGDQINSFKDLEAKLVKFEARSVTPNSTDCKSSCTGMCYTHCSGECRGCGSGCASGCTGSCKNTCDDTCEGECYYGCTTACARACSSGCTGGCSGGCESNCARTCRAGPGMQ